ncbi:MAG: hypothetical protein NT094_04595, partial [Candidatus Staskawiczbacteria bacterium]|nr:hypothetical protein [Candidatus Staskawiczbacteria bacterium]
MKKYLKYFLLIAIIAFIVPQITLAMWWNPFSWGFWNSLFHKQTPTTQVVCTKEAKLCPDGLTTVGRQGPKCEFTPCPVKYSCHTNSDCISQCTNGCVNNSWAQKNIDNSECLRAWSCSCINNVCYTDGNHPKN